MIKRDDLVKIGKFEKPHGIKGEISFSFSNDIFDEGESEFLICEMDGIPVPFQMESYRFNSASRAFMKLVGVDTDEQAKLFSNSDVYYHKKYIPEETVKADISSWDFFIGFTLCDENSGMTGVISDVDETTINTLFVIEKEDGRELLIPASENLILDINIEQKIIRMHLPDGLTEL